MFGVGETIAERAGRREMLAVGNRRVGLESG